MKRIIILVLVSLLCLTSCLNPNIDNRLVGEWQSCHYNDSKFIFRSNGTFERTTADRKTSKGKYTAVDGVLTLDYGEGYRKNELRYQVNTDKSSDYYGEIKINYEYFKKAK